MSTAPNTTENQHDLVKNLEKRTDAKIINWAGEG